MAVTKIEVLEPTWISWIGGTNPEGNNPVTVKYRDGSVQAGFSASDFEWSHDGLEHDEDLDIIAYFVATPRDLHSITTRISELLTREKQLKVALKETEKEVAFLTHKLKEILP